MMTVPCPENLISEYHRKQPDGHFFDKNTLSFFGESITKMKVDRKPIKIKDEMGQEHEVWVLHSYQKKHPDGPQWTTYYFDTETMDDIHRAEEKEVDLDHEVSDDEPSR